MPNWSYLIARLISAVGSWLDASNLRNRVYLLEQQNELLRVALDDITRMDPEGRIGWYAQQAIERADYREYPTRCLGNTVEYFAALNITGRG